MYVVSRFTGVCGYDSLNDMSPIFSGIEYLVPSCWHCLGWLRRCGLNGRSMSPGMGFESLKTRVILSLLSLLPV